MKTVSKKPAKKDDQPGRDTQAALAWLKRNSSPKVLAGMARYGLPSAKALGVPVGTIQKLARELGKNHPLAAALWATDIYEARLLAAYVGEPARLTVAQMDRWCRDFDNWGVVDTICFVLFDRTPHAWSRVKPWSQRKDEFQKRAGFVLLACLAAHDEAAGDDQFLALLPLVEDGAADERNFVKKGVSWALRMVGRRNQSLNSAAVTLARRLAASDQPSARWVGKGALKELTSPAMQKRVTER